MSCANVLAPPPDVPLHRCGLAYFSQAPLERKMQRLEAYPPVDMQGVCEAYQMPTVQLRTDLSVQGKLL